MGIAGLRLPDWIIDVAYVAVAATAGQVVLGRLTQTELYQRGATAGVPILSPILRGIDSITHQVVNK